MRKHLPFVILILLLAVMASAQEADDGERIDHEEWIELEGEGLTVFGGRTRENSPTEPVNDTYGPRNTVSAEQIAGQGSLDFLDALRDVPGVMTSRQNLAGATTGTSLYIRGRGYAHPALDITVTFDGAPRYGLIYGQTLADSIPVFAADSLSVFKSPQPASFGAGYAQVNVEPKYQAVQGWEGQAGLSGGSYNTWAENAAFGIRRGRFDAYAAQSFVTTRGHVVHSASRQQSYYLNLGLWVNAYWDIRLLGNYVDAQTEQAPKTGEDKDNILSTFATNTIFGTLTLNNEYDRAKGFIKLYYDNTAFTWLDDDKLVRGDYSKQKMNALGLRAKEAFSFWQGSDISAGLDLDWARSSNEDHNNAAPPQFSAFPDSLGLSPYLAISQFFGPGEKWGLRPYAGVRGYVHNIWQNAAAPQAGLALEYDRAALNLRYAMGVIYPAPGLVQRYLNTSIFDETRLKKIRPEQVHHFEAALAWTEPGLFSLNAAWFYDYGRDRIIINTDSIIPVNAASVSRFSVSGIEAGGSFGIEKNRLFLKKLSFFTGASWLFSVRARGEDGRTANKMPYSPEFSMSAGFNWVFLNSFRLSGDYQGLFGLYSGNIGQTANIAGPAETNKLGSVNLINLALFYTLSLPKIYLSEGEFFFRINNLLNWRYEYYQGYRMPGITFMLGARLKFKGK
jgi:iron complex outermembrane receptor protein